MTALENPPAFPTVIPNEFQFAHDGMTLRDWFAGQALASIAASVLDAGAKTAAAPEAIAQSLADCSYAMADAMLAARKPVQEPVS